ncbi:MAG: HEAT repeat domain-containing protein, partial [Planctomycetota bacterium]|nr:HEAT repeat domain-containing protein [Planctomycetota bacterium]
MQGIFIEFVRNLRDPIRSRRQEKIREVELSWSDRELASFRAFVAGLQPAEMSDICFALSDATAIPLLELLIDLAETNNELMQVAMRSLAKVPVSAKLYLANRLFSSKNNLIRSEACGLLAGTSKAALPFFLKALDDASELVTISAIKAIMKLELSEAADKIVPKLRSGTEEIKSLAMDALSRLGGNSKLFEDGLLAIYNNAGEKVSLRGKAAQVLALAKSQASHNVLLETVSSGRDAPELLRLSALALSAWPDRKTIDLLLSVANRNVAILAEAARRSIGQMDSEKALPLLVASLKNDSAAMAMAAADALGGMRHPGAGMALCEHLPGEERPAVIAAVSDALGRSGFSGAWQALRTKLATSRGSSALTLLASLADAAREANLDELSVFLENAADEKSQELLLRRLAAFSQ